MFMNHTKAENKAFQIKLADKERDVYSFFKEKPFGTAEQVARHKKERLNTVSTRLSALVNKGLVKETGYTMLNEDTGRYNTIYVSKERLDQTRELLKALSVNDFRVRRAKDKFVVHSNIYTVVGLTEGSPEVIKLTDNKDKAMKYFYESKNSNQWDDVLLKKNVMKQKFITN